MAVMFRTTLLLSLLLVLSGCSVEECPRDLPAITLAINGHHLEVEVADTPDSRRCGLAFRDQLAADRGMLFVYEQEQPLVFWMKNTRLPLSIAYLDGERRIVDLQDMTATESEQRYPSTAPARYALEANLGWFQRHGIAQGDQVLFELPGPASR